MNSSAEPESIFAGTTDIVGRFFGLKDGEHLKQISTARMLTGAAQNQEQFRQLVLELHETIETNWSGRIPSKENWRIERQTDLSPNNRSPEVLLERAIAILGGRGLLGDWYNQIPVASGLINDRADKRAAIDLLRYRENRAAFVELKWASDTPVFAAVEILLYGLAFIFSIEHREQLDYRELPMLDADEMKLEVLAPSEFYDGYNIAPLQQCLDTTLRDVVKEITDGALSTGFEFLAFPPQFQLPFSDGAEVLQLIECEPETPICKRLVSAIERITPVN